jgi:hypothetical protein
VTSHEIRNWLGLYVLCLTAFLGGYSFLAPDRILPLEANDRLASFEIILPFLIAQVSAVYRFYSDDKASSRSIHSQIPTWVVKAPPILVTTLLAVELLQFAIAGLGRSQPPSAETFKGLLTFCVALLNVSTVLVISRYFEVSKKHSEPTEHQESTAIQ